MDKKLKTLRAKIRKEVDWIDIRPYSHNIISLVLGQIAREYGKDEANKTIRDFKLNELGWSEEK